jgi:hypothetical protein
MPFHRSLSSQSFFRAFALASLPLLMLAGDLAAAPADSGKPGALKQLKHWLEIPRSERPALAETPFAKIPLSKAEADAALAALWQDRLSDLRSARAGEMKAREIELNGLKMKFQWLAFGEAPATGRSLFISLHGGGNASKEVNDSQWENQVALGKAYAPKEGIYVAPRAPTDTWNLWHQAHIDDFFARLIEDFVAFEKVNPDRVYVLGYSAGGDGIYQIVPRTPDRWAAASMMAGHPNAASPLGLRNVPFAIQVGAEDGGYRRNEVAKEWGRKLDALQQADPDGYIHFTELHPGKSHWMDLEDRKAIPWMEKFTRQPLPTRVVWQQGDAVHTRCYWLARPKEELKPGQTVTAERSGQVISLSATTAATATVLLNDAMLDLDKPVVVRDGQKPLFSGRLNRTVALLAQSLEERGDRELAFPASVTVKLSPSDSGSSGESHPKEALPTGGALREALRSVPAPQQEGMQFLLDNMPPQDKAALSPAFLTENVSLAYEALAKAPWAQRIPNDIFLNDLLPYAVLNEPRDNCRRQLRELALPLIQGCQSPTEAALALNSKLFDQAHVHYSKARPKPDQSPLESMKCGLASCTGLSILLVDACRAVGIPARIAGTPRWVNKPGNHTWVEIWDGDWHFLDAAAPDPAGLDHAWFVADAAQASEANKENAIFASSFKSTGLAFPLVWAPEIRWVNALEVTGRYARK